MEVLSSAELRGDRYYEVISSLRVALTNNTVTLVVFHFLFQLSSLHTTLLLVFPAT